MNKLLFPLLLSLFIVTPAVQADQTGQFRCVTYDLIEVVVYGTYSLDTDLPLQDEITVSLDNTFFFMPLEQVTEYTNVQTPDGQELSLLAHNRQGTKTVLSLQMTDGFGTLSLDYWGVYLNQAKANCTFTNPL